MKIAQIQISPFHPRTVNSRPVEYDDAAARAWVELYSPDEWHGNVLMQLCWVNFPSLMPAGSLRRPAIVEAYVRRLEEGRPLPPPVATLAPGKRLYLHDGNHRYYALAEYFGEQRTAEHVRVALVMPKPGYEFAWQDWDGYGTYVLTRKGKAEPMPQLGESASASAGA